MWVRIIKTLPKHLEGPDKPKIIVMDFDRVIHEDTSPWMGTTVIQDEPVPGAFEAIMRYQAAGYEIWIMSCRCNHPDGPTAMAKWMMDKGLRQSVVEEIRFSLIKPRAFMYIDDRAFVFKGKFPAVEVIENFRSWNKEKPRIDASEIKDATELIEVLEEYGVEAEQLDDLVHESASTDASTANNGGLWEQIPYLLSSGWKIGMLISRLRDMKVIG